MKEFVRDRYLPHVKSYKRSWCTDETVLRLHILPVLGAKPVDQVKNEEISDLLQAMREKGYASGTTNRVLILLRYIYNLGRKWRVAGMNENPTMGLATAPDVQRDRFLTPEEGQRLIVAIEQDENQTAAQAILLLLLTGARRNEITQAKWDYVSWERRTLLVPLSKSGKPRAIALNAQALALLRAIPRTDNPYIFPSPVNGKPSPRCSSRGTASGGAPASPTCGCTICGIPTRASWSIRGSRSTWCRACWGMPIPAPRSATPIWRMRRCWTPPNASRAQLPVRIKRLRRRRRPRRAPLINPRASPPRLSLGGRRRGSPIGGLRTRHRH